MSQEDHTFISQHDINIHIYFILENWDMPKQGFDLFSLALGDGAVLAVQNFETNVSFTKWGQFNSCHSM